ncbi:receptor-like protein 12 [Gossypium australe]|uniref:Receptor-like protein 12 n=1 Tax=Gossypium australe TaxID=47621 RepID=A0A5B6UZ42_9ROSI|nr:receptor-like protein 12 [Gossypium australe]
MPERIISDNALNLNSSIIVEVYSQFKIKHHNSSLYRPKINGAVEAANKNIKKIGGKMTNTYKDWHENYYLPFILIEHLLEPPSVYGIEAVFPIEVEIPSLLILSELKLNENQLNLIEEKRLKAIRHGQMYQK